MNLYHETLRNGYGYAGMTVAIWSGFILVSRLGGASPLTPFDITALRFGTAALLLFPIWLTQRPLALFDGRIAALTLTGGIGYALLVYSGFKLAPATHAAVLLPGLLPVEIALLGWILLGEQPSVTRWVGLSVIAVGVGCLAAESFRTGFEAWRGDFLLIAASFCWALYTVLARRWAVAAWAATTGVALLAALIFLPVYLLFLPKALGTAPWTSIVMQALYQGVLAVVVAMVLYMKAMAILGPVRLGAFMALVPVVSGLMTALVLGEALSPWSVAGLVLVSTGAYASSRKQLVFTEKHHALCEHSDHA